MGYDVNDNGVGSWTIQNSWGADWGDNGFIRLELFGGQSGDEDPRKYGVCNINKYGSSSVEFDSESI